MVNKDAYKCTPWIILRNPADFRAKMMAQHRARSWFPRDDRHCTLISCFDFCRCAVFIPVKKTLRGPRSVVYSKPTTRHVIGRAPVSAAQYSRSAFRSCAWKKISTNSRAEKSPKQFLTRSFLVSRHCLRCFPIPPYLYHFTLKLLHQEQIPKLVFVVDNPSLFITPPSDRRIRRPDFGTLIGSTVTSFTTNLAV